MSKLFDLLTSLSSLSLVSGRESPYYDQEVPSPFSDLGATVDLSGNLLLVKASGKKSAKKILIEAHLDEIGLCVKDITMDGFVSVCACGGIDVGILPGTEFKIFGKKVISAVASSIPPHLKKKEDADKKPDISDIYLDCGFADQKEAEEMIAIGDAIHFADAPIRLVNDRICAPSLDNKAAVISLLLAYQNAVSEHDLYFLFTVGEESTSRGVKNFGFSFSPDAAIIVDAGFAHTRGLDKSKCIQMGMGPAVSFTDTLSRDFTKWVIDSAKKNNLPLQIICEPGGTGTSATALQLQNGGIPSVVISIPLKNMHTPSEIVYEKDIEDTAALLCSLMKEKKIPTQEVILVERL